MCDEERGQISHRELLGRGERPQRPQAPSYHLFFRQNLPQRVGRFLRKLAGRGTLLKHTAGTPHEPVVRGELQLDQLRVG